MFFEDGQNKYFFDGIYSQYVIVRYEDGTSENIFPALKSGKAAIAALQRKKFVISCSQRKKGAFIAKQRRYTGFCMGICQFGFDRPQHKKLIVFRADR